MSEPTQMEPLSKEEVAIVTRAAERAESLMNSVTAELCIHYRRALAAQRTALLSLAQRIRREGMQGVANELEEIVNVVPAR